MISVVGKRWENLEGLGVGIIEEMRPRILAATRAAAIYLVGEIQVTLSGPRHGRAYKISRTGRLHIASAPGEPPAVLYGRLRQSVTWTEPEWVGDVCASAVGPNVVYARRLEFGGVDSRGIRILPRPYMEPTVIRAAAEIDRLLEIQV